MRRSLEPLILVAMVLLFVCSQPAFAQSPSNARVEVVPHSGAQTFDPSGVRAHTNFLILVRSTSSAGAPSGETPASLACVYKLTKPVKGCPISGTTENPVGGAKAIAVVSAYDNPDAKFDLDAFSQQFGLPAASFEQVYANGQQPKNDPGGWSLEEALAIEWAHGMAPKAKVYLVEATTNSFADLLQAESVASKLVAKAGGGEVADSWGASEFSGEQAYDKYFKTKGVVYFAASGEQSGQLLYPSTSPYVVSAGGTTVNRDSEGNFTGESGCCSGGVSEYESRPSYQDIIKKIVGNFRGTPDVSFDSAPASGVSVYDADGDYDWLVLGGTAVSAPAQAGIFNVAGHFYGSTETELTQIYKEYGVRKEYHAWFRDITKPDGCAKGWDFCSGVGSNLTYKGK